MTTITVAQLLPVRHHRLRSAEVRPACYDAARSILPRRVRLAGSTTQRLLRSAPNPHPQSRT
ncbi:hypothetical protein [Corynebacterium matruchotii]|uniref:hypothetical protein n=1 Tax=Corynebacterium matruchotii TaxID=43768 RepID=UPI00288AB82C|nr:hypothetical protein [Corynebacterium matruchotii]